MTNESNQPAVTIAEAIDFNDIYLNTSNYARDTNPHGIAVAPKFSLKTFGTTMNEFNETILTYDRKPVLCPQLPLLPKTQRHLSWLRKHGRLKIVGWFNRPVSYNQDGEVHSDFDICYAYSGGFCVNSRTDQRDDWYCADYVRLFPNRYVQEETEAKTHLVMFPESENGEKVTKGMLNFMNNQFLADLQLSVNFQENLLKEKKLSKCTLFNGQYVNVEKTK